MSEKDRLSALMETGLLDSENEERFDRITRLASNSLQADAAFISFIDETRQWFKSKHGVTLTQTDRDIAFCDHAIKQEDVMIVADAELDARFSENPLVTGDPHIRFYAGAPLLTKSGHALGTLCIVDSQPRHDFSDTDVQVLKDLAEGVMREIEIAKSEQLVEDLSIVNEELRHRMGNMYAHVSALISLMGRNEDDKDKLVRRLREKVTALGHTQALLAANQWSSVPVRKLIETTLEPFLNDTNKTRLSIKGGENFDVSSRGAFILTLMLSELGTNAVKHGALGPRDGELKIDWSTGETIELQWTETLKKQAEVSVGKGFGTDILKRVVPMDLKGEAHYDLTQNGLAYRVTAMPDRVCAAI